MNVNTTTEISVVILKNFKFWFPLHTGFGGVRSAYKKMAYISVQPAALSTAQVRTYVVRDLRAHPREKPYWCGSVS